MEIKPVPNKDEIWKVVRILPTDYSDYGGQVRRWSDPEKNYPDCSSGCRYYQRLISRQEEGVEDADWGVCMKIGSPRQGLLTFEHQAGDSCWEGDNG